MSPNLTLSHIDEVNEIEVSNYIENIPIRKLINDCIPLKIIRHILPYIIKPLTHVVNLSLSSDIMHDVVKIAIVTPIHKGGDTNDHSNNRPISILLILGKAMNS